jgi:2-oxoglutarate ferredoxin oxidoreductase subunit beta
VSTLLQTSRFLDTKALPHFWCEGCGNGIVLGAIVRALDKSGLDPEETVMVTGIGCTGKLDDYVACHTVHGTHGRALPIATGIKAANPDLAVIAVLGDGDGATIGGNHLLHSARRNIGVTAVLVNNFNYGMTGGQYSGTTPIGSRTSTSVYGDPEPAMDLCRVVEAAGASFVARSTVYHVTQLQRQIEEGLMRDGFAFIEAVSTCPTYYGRFNGRASPIEMLLSLKDRVVPVGSSEETGTPGLDGKFATGVFADRRSPGFSARYAEVQAAALKKAGEPARAAGIAAAATEGVRAATGQAGGGRRAEPAAADYWEIVFAGSGGQGLGLAGMLLGQAAVEFDGKNSSQTQAYGTAARGGFAKSELIVSAEEVKYPGVTRPNIVMALSPEAYSRYAGRIPGDCLFIYDEDAVPEGGSPGVPDAHGRAYPITKAARDMGEPQSANLIGLGVLAGITKMVSPSALEQMISRRLPGRKGPVEAFRKGLALVARDA